MIKTETRCIYRLFFVLLSTAKQNIFTDILNVGESTQDVGEETVGEMTHRRNDRNSEIRLLIQIGLIIFFSFFFAV